MSVARRMHARLQRGQAMVEYTVIGAALMVALFVVDYPGGRTGAQYLADLIRLFFRNLTYFLSLP